MKTIEKCAQCGADLPEHTPGSRCPQCLLELGLEEETTFDAARRTSPAPATPPLDFGDYDLLDEIARGGMGVVYKARQKSLNRTVALKLILSGQFASKEQVQRFRAEAEAAANLRHPNIVAIHEIGEKGGHHFFSMDYVQGNDLASVVREQPISAKRAARYARIIAQAIQHAHEQGTLHRDLKPSNVLLDADDQPRVTDFGLAKRLSGDEGLTVTGQVMGSPGFMPPEQASGCQAKIGPPADVYGIGAILYHLVTARAPFQAATVAAVLKQVQEQDPVPPRMLNPSVPRDIETICLKCLEKDPAKRYPSAQALADELDRFLQDEPIHARPVSAPEKAWRWCRRKPVVAGLVVGLLAAILLGTGTTAWQLRRVADTAHQLRARAYASEMNLAHRALLEKNMGRATALLQAQVPKPGEPDLRGFEWRYLANQCRDESYATVLAHEGDLHYMALSRDSRWLVTSAADHSVKLWKLPELRLEKTLHLFTKKGFYYIEIALSDDGRLLAASDADNTLVWELPAGHLIKTIPAARAPMFTPRSQRLLTRHATNFWLWNTQSWTNAPLRLTNVVNLAWSSDEQWLTTVEQQKTHYVVRLYDASGQYTGDLDGRLINAEIYPAVRFSPDSRLIAGWTVNSEVFIWDRVSRALITNFQAQSPFMLLTFSPDGRRMATGGSGDHFIRIWSVPEFRLQQELYGHVGGVRGLAFTADGQTLVSGSRDRTVKLWHPQDVRPREFLAEADTFAGFTQGGQIAITLDVDATVKFWDLEAQQVVRTERWTTNRTATAGFVSEDGKVIALGFRDGTIDIRDLPGGELRRTLKTGPAEVVLIRLSRDGRRLATILFPCPGGAFSVWDTTTGKEIREVSAYVGGSASGVEFCHHGDLVAVGRHEDDAITVWDLSTKGERFRLSGHTWVVNQFAFAPDDQVLASSSWDGTVRLWDLGNGRELPGRFEGHGLTAEVGGYSPDGRTLAVSIARGITLWHVGSRQEMGTLQAAPSAWRDFRFSPDGNTLAVGAVLADREALRVGPGVQFWRARPLSERKNDSGESAHR